MSDKLILGSHVGMSAPDYYIGAINEALSYGANTFMIYTGAPQNTRRLATEQMHALEGIKYLKEKGMDIKHIVAHAPYIINLGNSVKPETYELAVSFLQDELQRVADFGITMVVLHPGSHVGAGVEAGTEQIIKGLNTVLDNDTSGTIIALETMAGKGTEIGRTFEEIRTIIDGVHKKSQLGVCLDTCHINDAGYDVHDIDGVLDEFDRVIGLEYLKVVHVNDSKNERGAAKDRHENIGFGTIGYDTLMKYIYSPRLAHLPKILETPYINGVAPYGHEITMIKNKVWNATLKDELGEK
ncbi:MAG: deoxyribonuclease IV [Bacilli bacterium]|jgi:deoxyribonuclease-4|nr:deoxyribonuclease IV [Bacillota bacterium]NLI51852.1 deoxyribonuclease IV [Erysipelotrichaceae bacterium]HOA11484.1 deoxyribonuclease IV [Bacilli bacterium]TAH59186.1 MAG: deoxyribonuclease IV [Bacillota bacterium]HPY78900.1 deoxyribonuclease IV [Bacilli bacterium]